MIKKIKISALKSIDKLEMSCSKLNIITGTNSSGKSTLLQAILLFFQQIDSKQRLNGDLISLGEFRTDAKNYNITADKIEVELYDDIYPNVILKAMFVDDDSDMPYANRSTGGETLEEIQECEKGYSSDKLRYLSCNRIGAQDVYMKNYSHEDGIGKNGEYAFHYLQQHKADRLEPALIFDNTSETLYTQVNHWLHSIVNASINIEDVPGTDIVKSSFSVGEGRSSRPRNVGSGISYIASVVIMCLASKRDDVLIIENPEIHLHPRAQARVCEFLYRIAVSGRQLFIETHSDHIFNGIRAGIATEEMKRDDIAVNFFELDDNNCTKNTPIEFGKRGRILNYTDGLFDQFDIDLNKMLDL